jgi:hypothetical protein
MDKLTSTIIDAHGGLDRFRRFDTLSAHLIQGGALWMLKGKDGVLDDTTVTINLRREHASHAPFGNASRRSSVSPDLVQLLSADGTVLDSLPDPRASFVGHMLETPWSDLQLAYFAGIAMWTYLTMPFLLATDGVVSREIEPWDTHGERWRRLSVELPASVATHSRRQTLYVGSDGLLKRHDYDVEIAGNTPGAHFVADYVEVEGIKFPTRRRIFPRQPDGQAMAEPLVVSIDLDRIELR